MTPSPLPELITHIEAIDLRLLAVEHALAAPQWQRPGEGSVAVPVERLKDAIAVCHGVSHHKLADDLAALIPEESPDA